MFESEELRADTIDIAIVTNYLPEQSVPEEQRFVFSYTITIKNTGTQAAQLISRSWLITNANGETSEVKGDGVIGKQPRIQPDTSFTYTSGCILETPIGTMQGFYQMQNSAKKPFSVEIPVFRLAIPNILN